MQGCENNIKNLLKICNKQNKSSIIKSINLIIKDNNMTNIKLININNVNNKFFKNNRSIRNNKNLFCTICQNTIDKGEHKVELNKCCHVFHRKCLNKYIKSTLVDFSCPNCKKSYKEDLLEISNNIAFQQIV